MIRPCTRSNSRAASATCTRTAGRPVDLQGPLRIPTCTPSLGLGLVLIRSNLIILAPLFAGPAAATETPGSAGERPEDRSRRRFHDNLHGHAGGHHWRAGDARVIIPAGRVASSGSSGAAARRDEQLEPRGRAPRIRAGLWIFFFAAAACSFPPSGRAPPARSPPSPASAPARRDRRPRAPSRQSLHGPGPLHGTSSSSPSRSSGAFDLRCWSAPTVLGAVLGEIRAVS